jgi:anti-sigma factor RsiW
LNCRDLILEVSNYIDGDVDAALKQEIEEHLKDCPDCMVIVIQTKLTVEIFCDNQQVELPQDVRSRLHEALQRKIRNPGS